MCLARRRQGGRLVVMLRTLTGCIDRVETCRLPKSYEDAKCIADRIVPAKWSKWLYNYEDDNDDHQDGRDLIDEAPMTRRLRIAIFGKSPCRRRQIAMHR